MVTDMMKLAVKKDEGSVPGGGFHYMTFPRPMESQVEEDLFRSLGYVIIAVPVERGQRLLEEATASLRHEMEVALLTDAAEQADKVKPPS